MRMIEAWVMFTHRSAASERDSRRAPRAGERRRQTRRVTLFTGKNGRLKDIDVEEGGRR